MTYSILASDPEHGLLGVATASYSLAVGAGVPLLRTGTGVVVSQAHTNRALREYALDGLDAGRTVQALIDDVPIRDSGAELRQVALIDAEGRSGAHTGSNCSKWAGHRFVRVGDICVVVLGNLLAGEHVLDEMVTAFSAESLTAGPGALGQRLVRSLRAGECAGGDLRGKQSAALLVAQTPVPFDRTRPAPLEFDLRVDDSPEPITELERLLVKALRP